MPKSLRRFISSLLIYFLLILFSPSSVQAVENILFFDDFNDGNISGWSVYSGNWSVNNGHLLASTTGVFNFLGEINTGSSEWDNYQIEFDINQINGVDNGILFRKSGENYYAFNLRHGTGLHNTPEIKFFKTVNGASTQVTSSNNQQLLNNIWYHIKIEVNNENIKLWVGNNLVFDLNDPGTTIKKGGIGFQSWTGAIGSVQIRFDNVKITAFEPPKTPLILIPGIGGSEFKVAEDTIWNKDDGHGGIFNHAYAKDEKVWVNTNEAIKPGNDDYFDILRMKTDGITSEANLELTGELFSGAYQDTIDFFTEDGYELDKTLFIFPYDWRKDITSTAPLLNQKISEIKSDTGAEKVDIVAHSMGGLVARNYIGDTTNAQNVRKLIELGTPHLGSAKLLKTIVYGDCLILPFGPFCLALAPSEVKDVIQNMIGGFELANSQAYFNFYDGVDLQHPLPFKDDRDIDSNGVIGPLNYSQIKALLTNLGHNASLFTPAENFHNLDNKLINTNGVDVSVVAGSGITTLGQIIERNVINYAGIKITEKDGLMINGDDTVPLFSASLDDPAKNRSLLGTAKIYYTKQKHGDLIKEGSSINLVKNILSGDTQIPDGISTTPFTVKGKIISLHSPVNIMITDSFNNQTGIDSNGDLQNNIPGSTIETLDDAKFIWLPDEGQYNISLQATGDGSFDFKIRDFDNDINTKTTLYKDIPINTSSKGQLLFNTQSITPPTIQLDQNGDGTFEKNINPTGVVTGSEYLDITPPEIQASFNIQTKKIEISSLGETNSVQTFNPQTGTKIFKDLADNSTTIEFTQTNKNFLESLSLKKLQYNNSDSILPANQFLVLYSTNPKTNKVTVINQDIIIKGDKIIATLYNPLTNKTTIYRKDKVGKLITEVKIGMTLVKLTTQNGQLVVNY